MEHDATPKVTGWQLASGAFTEIETVLLTKQTYVKLFHPGYCWSVRLSSCLNHLEFVLMKPKDDIQSLNNP